MHLSDKQREAAFPIHIELGVKDGDRVSYPVAYLGDIDGIDQLPDEGCALVHFRKTEDGSVEMQRICLADDAEEGDSGDYAPDTLESVLEKADRKPKKTDDENGGR